MEVPTLYMVRIGNTRPSSFAVERSRCSEGDEHHVETDQGSTRISERHAKRKLVRLIGEEMNENILSHLCAVLKHLESDHSDGRRAERYVEARRLRQPLRGITLELRWIGGRGAVGTASIHLSDVRSTRQ
jgi:hypothetical protein